MAGRLGKTVALALHCRPICVLGTRRVDIRNSLLHSASANANWIRDGRVFSRFVD